MTIVFTDWDGTVTLQDSNDYLTDNIGFGHKERMVINQEILEGTQSFRDGFKLMLDSVTTPFPGCIDLLLKNIVLDSGFKQFYEWCESQSITVVVVSSGMKPIIHALLLKMLGPEAVRNIEIISNDVKIDPVTQEWDIVYRNPESPFGHDKSKSIRQWLAEHKTPSTETLFYCGDGVSDLSAAKETDLLFAKHGKDLITYCKHEKIPYTEFNDFSDILDKVQRITGGEPIAGFLEN